VHDCGGYFQRFVIILLPLAGRFFPLCVTSLAIFCIDAIYIFKSISKPSFAHKWSVACCVI